MSEEGIVVCTPEPHARVDAYGFIKNTVYRRLRRRFHKVDHIKSTIEEFARLAGGKSGKVEELLDMIDARDAEAGMEARTLLHAFRPKLLLNRVRNKRQIQEAHRFMGLVKEYLSTEMNYIGYVRSDTKILDTCERRRPLLIDSPKAQASKDLCNILMNGLQVSDRLHRFSPENNRKITEVAKAEAKFW